MGATRKGVGVWKDGQRVFSGAKAVNVRTQAEVKAGHAAFVAYASQRQAERKQAALRVYGLAEVLAHVLRRLGCFDDFFQAAQLGNIANLAHSRHQFAAGLSELRL